jgi:UDP-glucose 4-epimerase
MKKNILVTGGAGFVGSHIVKLLAIKGYSPITVDNLSIGSVNAVVAGEFIEGDLADIQALDNIFSSHRIDAVMHFAAFIDIRESMMDPAKYYNNNVCNTYNLLEMMRKHGVKNLIFSSSAGIFGYPHMEKIDENHPVKPISPYGKSKLIVEMMLEDYDSAYGIKSSCLRYFNAAGGDPEGVVKNHKKVESNLIPLILKSLNDKNGCITIYGTDYPTRDGTCVRDYVHVNDLARAHILALEKLWKEKKSTHYNLGNGNGFSIREVIDSVERVTGKKVRVKEGDRRPGDPPILIADSSKAEDDLKWTPEFPKLDTIVLHAWQAITKE